MTVEEKFDALYNAANKAWDGAFGGWEWYEDNVESKKYVLGEKDGRVTGFVKGVEIPYIRTDTAVNSLPYDVQQKLREGIEFESEQEMRRVMDEWCS